MIEEVSIDKFIEELEFLKQCGITTINKGNLIDAFDELITTLEDKELEDYVKILFELSALAKNSKEI